MRYWHDREGRVRSHRHIQSSIVECHRHPGKPSLQEASTLMDGSGTRAVSEMHLAADGNVSGAF